MTLNSLLPTFVQGTHRMHDVLMYPAAILCYVGLVIRILPGRSPWSFGMALLRVAIVVAVIGSISQIGDVINQMAASITQATGFNVQGNMLADYQTALATKYSHAIVTQPGNPNPWQFLSGGIAQAVDQIGLTWIGSLVLVGSWLAASMMFAMLAIQQILFYLELAMSPLFLAAIMIPVLLPVATRFCTWFVAICLFPLGFRIVDLLMKLVLDAAVNSGNNVGVTVANAMGGSVFLWVLVAVIGFIGYPFAAIIIVFSMVTSGSHGLGVAIPALFGMGMMASRIGSNAVSTGSGAINNMANSSPSAPHKNYAVWANP